MKVLWMKIGQTVNAISPNYTTEITRMKGLMAGMNGWKLQTVLISRPKHVHFLKTMTEIMPYILLQH